MWTQRRHYNLTALLMWSLRSCQHCLLLQLPPPQPCPYLVIRVVDITKTNRSVGEEHSQVSPAQCANIFLARWTQCTCDAHGSGKGSKEHIIIHYIIGGHIRVDRYGLSHLLLFSPLNTIHSPVWESCREFLLKGRLLVFECLRLSNMSSLHILPGADDVSFKLKWIQVGHVFLA